MTTSAVLWIAGLLVLVLALVYMTKKGWVSWRGSHGIATLTAFHDFQPKDKQQAIEFVMERKAGKRLEADESGEGERDTKSDEERPVASR